jgi:hypothetical protein
MHQQEEIRERPRGIGSLQLVPPQGLTPAAADSRDELEGYGEGACGDPRCRGGGGRRRCDQRGVRDRRCEAAPTISADGARIRAL